MNVTATTEADVTLNSTSLTKERTVNITDAGTETLAVDVSFASSTNTSANVRVTDSADASAYDAAYAQVSEDSTTSGGLLGGDDIFGQDPTVAAVVGLVLVVENLFRNAIDHGIQL